jgi:hypothetical protein
VIVAFAGYSGSGKDEAGKVLVARGFKRIAFADKVKELAYKLGWDGQKDDKGRALLQALGDGAREVIGKDVWIEAVMPTLRHAAKSDTDHVVVTDCRYKNELEALRSLGQARNRVFWISRPDVGPLNEHISENELGIEDFRQHDVIWNVGDLFDLRQQIDRAVVRGV